MIKNHIKPPSPANSGKNLTYHPNNNNNRNNSSSGGSESRFVNSPSEVKTGNNRNRKYRYCEHKEKLKHEENALDSYSKICTHLITCLSVESELLKTEANKCLICNRTNGVLVMCLSCIYVACARRGHFNDHAKDKDHPLGCDLSTGNLYCYKCCDFVYDQEFEAILRSARLRQQWMMNLPMEASFHGLTSPRLTESMIIGEPICVSPTTPKTTFGLRGLINLGHTCFMNCIVQSLIHTPLLRNFFLTERIHCSEKHDSQGQKPCIVTLVCDLYQEFHDGSKDPMSLHGLLYKIWGNAAHLAGYEQQDAHEFFIAMLDALHLHFNRRLGSVECNCIIDGIFLGKLQSSVVCTVCGHKSITVDPFWDISLDLATEDPTEVLTLKECLNRYTRIEHLGETGMIHCNFCGKNQQSTKQLQFKSLPYVLSLHLKRFEHRTSYKKIDNFVKFPEYLDLTEYTSAYDECQNISADIDLDHKNKFIEYRYALYAVVNHVGSLDGGHYYAFIRHSRNEWYKCDDHWLTLASRDGVLSTHAYLLFYQKEAVLYNYNNDDKSRIPGSDENIEFTEEDILENSA